MTQIPLPRFIQPMAARLVTALPEGAEWQYEVKFDGYRVLLMKAGGRLPARRAAGVSPRDALR